MKIHITVLHKDEVILRAPFSAGKIKKLPSCSLVSFVVENLSLLQRQPDGELRAFFLLTVDFDPSIMTPDDIIGDRQA